MTIHDARSGAPGAEVTEVVEGIEAADEAAKPSPDEALERLLDRVESAAPAPSASAASAQADAPPPLRMARIASMHGGGFQITWRGRPAPIEAELGDGVDHALIERAARQGDAVLVEADPVLGPLIVGVVQTRIPETLELKASRIVIEGENEVLLRSGGAALRLREDGDVEMVGSRIVSMSRGLYRLVGRVLRLN